MKVNWKVRIQTLSKYWELEELKIAARSVITDLHNKQYDKIEQNRNNFYREEYSEHSTGVRCAVYRDLILCDALDEICKPVDSSK
ncbi:unnamed protein product [Brugia pahangi]|uniref:Phage protein n=1 Tax=Brugia pahangi TaxID=6280 RepID=A0A0N4SWQ3_BRUPA|nr:unnamed protein product [Brugia pahangi]